MRLPRHAFVSAALAALLGAPLADAGDPAAVKIRYATEKVGDLDIFYREAGPADAPTIVLLHGFPTSSHMFRNLIPALATRYHVVAPDYPGYGASSAPPHDQFEYSFDNLAAIVDQFLQQKQLTRYALYVMDYGAPIGFRIAAAHPERVTELVLRGIFLVRPWEFRWFYETPDGTGALFPDLYEHYIRPIPPAERGDVMKAYYRRLTSDDPAVVREAARAWSIWEGATSFLKLNPDYLDKFEDDDFAAAFARIECHYFINGGFLRTPNQLLEDVPKIRHIPAVIVQGRYDVVCPMKSAWDLHRAWPEAELHIVPDAGHSAFEPGIIDQLVRATRKFSRRKP